MIIDSETIEQNLQKEWDFEKNHDKDISMYTPMSNQKVWWKCERGHSWKAAISKRTSGEKCPFCQGKKVLPGFNDLATTHPYLINEWDIEKNITISPLDVSKGSTKKIWWKCKKGHSWQAPVYSRTNGTGCPKCMLESQTSFPEKAIYFYIRKFFPSAICNYTNPEFLENFELDVYIPDHHIGIEYDGQNWHKHPDNDTKKNEICSSSGITLIRIREPGCPILSDEKSINIIMTNKHYGLTRAIEELFVILQKLLNLNFQPKINLEQDYIEITELINPQSKKNNLADIHPELLDSWDWVKNRGILPQQISTGSDKKVWWLCDKYKHSYLMSVTAKVRGRNCPICSGKQVLIGFNDLRTHFPDLAKEWDYDKNIIIPEEVTYGSDKIIWWRCEKGHSYQCSINNRRSGQACPYCSGKKVLTGYNDIKTTHPTITEEWCYELNEIDPSKINAGSHKRVWWQCKNGHRWNCMVYSRCLYNSGCPYCSGRKK